MPEEITQGKTTDLQQVVDILATTPRTEDQRNECRKPYKKEGDIPFCFLDNRTQINSSKTRDRSLS